MVGTGLSAALFYFGIAYLKAKCAEPLAVFSLVAAGSLLLTTVCIALDDPKYGLRGMLSWDSNVKKERTKGGVTWFAVVEIILAVFTISVFFYGAYIVLNMFGRQKNSEVCDPKLYDPLVSWGGAKGEMLGRGVSCRVPSCPRKKGLSLP